MPLNDVINWITGLVKKHGFIPMDDGGAERHGAWEWTWLKARHSGHAYITLAALECEPGTYRVQIWAGTDDSNHFARHLVRELSSLREVTLFTDTDFKIRKAIIESIDEAAIYSMTVPASSLTGSYLITD